MSTPLQLQVCREIDKIDRVGRNGVLARLTTGATDESGAYLPGLGIHPAQAELLLGMICDGGDEPLAHTARVSSRLRLLAHLEETSDPSGSGTVWDWLLAMPVNADNTWSDGRRPENIAWALDDLVERLTDKSKRPGPRRHPS